MEVLLAYALFIIVLAIPFVVIGAVAAAFLGGIAAVAVCVFRRRPAWAVLGLPLMVASGAAAMTIQHWATTPPTDAGASSAHRVVYQTYREMRARQQAMRWLRDGTFAKKGESRDADRFSTSPGGGKQ